uniref:Uncharacterized protein n=1 Tax=Leersia perrieri TaxID=77586 RepID=A0A0D9XP06_9ORYZ
MSNELCSHSGTAHWPIRPKCPKRPTAWYSSNNHVLKNKAQLEIPQVVVAGDGEVGDEALRYLPIHEDPPRSSSQIRRYCRRLWCLGLLRGRSSVGGDCEGEGSVGVVRLSYRFLPDPPHLRRRHHRLPSTPVNSNQNGRTSPVKWHGKGLNLVCPRCCSIVMWH